MKFILLTCAILGVFPGISFAAATRVNWFNRNGLELRDFSGIPLFQGTNSGDYDGDIIQLGYYTMATTMSPFSGIWTPLETWTIGQKLSGNNRAGLFSYGSIIPTSSELLGIPLSMRFYDSPTLESATFYNNVASSIGTWDMVHSSTESLVMNLSLGDQGISWQDGSGSAFRTTIPVPEPGILGLIVLLALPFLKTRHRGTPDQ